MNMDQEVQRFRMDLLRKMPFYGDIVMRLPFAPNPQIETARTNGYQIEYSPKFFEKLNREQRRYVLMHEVLHVMLFHCSRRKERDPELWNVAADMVVNDALDKLSQHMGSRDLTIARPPDGIYAPVSDMETVENVYEVLKEENSSRKQGGKVKYTFRQWYRSTTYEMPSTNDLVIGKAAEKADENGKQVLDPEGGAFAAEQIPDHEAALREAMVQTILKEAMEKNRGEIGSYYVPRELLKLTESKKLDWRQLLRNLLDEETSEESSYITPERKYIHMDLILPGYSRDEMKLEEAWAFVDSSGSVGSNELEQFLTQLSRVCRQFKCTMNIAYWDTEVTDVYRNVTEEKKIWESLPKHTGGTDINCVYRWLRKEKLRPPAMLILTDGYYGPLDEEVFIPSLKGSTILVLSSDIRENDEMHRIGKITRL